jgi:uncharacterized membrane protein YphA (DoxX/SURF4 family)
MTKYKLPFEIICLLFVVLFLYTGINKASDINTFSAVFDHLPFPVRISSWLPYLIIAFELFAATTLLIPKSRLLGLYTSFSLMTVFTIYIAILLLNDKKLPCSCGGVLRQMNWRQHLIFNLFFLVLALIGIILFDRQQTLSKKTFN